MLSRLIVKGRIEEATGIVNGANVRTVPITEVDRTFMCENTRVMSQILYIKKGVPGKKKTVTRESPFGKILKLEHPYDRMILCRNKSAYHFIMAETADTARKWIHRVVKPGVTPEQMRQIYDEWGDDYEQHLLSLDYKAPDEIAKAVAELFPSDRDKVKILDVGAGSGLVGIKLHLEGFSDVDGLDPSQKLLEFAKKKNVYRRYICEFLTGKPLDIEANIYDAVTLCGVFGDGHVPSEAMHEVVRLTKPGGYVVIATSDKHMNKIEEFGVKFAALSDKSEESEGKWIKVKKCNFPQIYIAEDGNPLQGNLIIYKVC